MLRSRVSCTIRSSLAPLRRCGPSWSLLCDKWEPFPVTLGAFCGLFSSWVPVALLHELTELRPMSEQNVVLLKNPGYSWSDFWSSFLWHFSSLELFSTVPATSDTVNSYFCLCNSLRQLQFCLASSSCFANPNVLGHRKTHLFPFSQSS